jgi:hypothetical protein
MLENNEILSNSSLFETDWPHADIYDNELVADAIGEHFELELVSFP